MNLSLMNFIIRICKWEFSVSVCQRLMGFYVLNSSALKIKFQIFISLDLLHAYSAVKWGKKGKHPNLAKLLIRSLLYMFPETMDLLNTRSFKHLSL